MRFDVPMTNTKRVYVKQSSKCLIRIQLHLKGGQCLSISPNVAIKIALVILHDDVKILIVVFFSGEGA